jgi:hypothetical protein
MLFAFQTRRKIAILFHHMPCSPDRNLESFPLEHVADLAWSIARMLTPHGKDFPVTLRLGVFNYDLASFFVRGIRHSTTFQATAPFIDACPRQLESLCCSLDIMGNGVFQNLLLLSGRIALAPGRTAPLLLADFLFLSCTFTFLCHRRSPFSSDL